jgi:MoxR-like ATPase
MSENVNDTFDTEETRELVKAFQTANSNIREQIAGTIIGQQQIVDNLLTTLYVGGHCLITGMPGTAKTLLVHTLASALGLTFKRIQFTLT